MKSLKGAEGKEKLIHSLEEGRILNIVREPSYIINTVSVGTHHPTHESRFPSGGNYFAFQACTHLYQTQSISCIKDEVNVQCSDRIPSLVLISRSRFFMKEGYTCELPLKFTWSPHNVPLSCCSTGETAYSLIGVGAIVMHSWKLVREMSRISVRTNVSTRGSGIGLVEVYLFWLFGEGPARARRGNSKASSRKDTYISNSLICCSFERPGAI